MLKDLQWPLWLPEEWYNKLCIHHLTNPRKRCTSIVISIGCKVGDCTMRAKSDIYDWFDCRTFFIWLLVIYAHLQLKML